MSLWTHEEDVTPWYWGLNPGPHVIFTIGAEDKQQYYMYITYIYI